jgi:predicted PurR-regulated permease PerM
MERKVITFDTFIRWSLGIALFIALFLLVNRLSGVLLPFFIAWLIAYMIYPLVHFIQFKLHFKSRIISIIVALIFLIGIVGGIIYLIVPSIVEEVGKFEKLIAYYFRQGSLASGNIPKQLNAFIQRNIDINSIEKILKDGTLTNFLKEGIPKLWQILSDSISYIFSIIASFIVLLYLFFILKDYETMSDGWVKLIPAKHRELITGIVSDVEQGMNQYFRGQAMVSLCIGILFAIGFLIIDFPLAIGLGLCIGVLSMIPYMHALGLIPVALLSILKAADTGQNYWIILLSALAVFAVVQLIEDTILVPKIMGKITGLNPAVILLALSVWGSLMGILGMIIALPLTTIMLSYYKRYILKQEKKI